MANVVILGGIPLLYANLYIQIIRNRKFVPKSSDFCTACIRSLCNQMLYFARLDMPVLSVPTFKLVRNKYNNIMVQSLLGAYNPSCTIEPVKDL